LDITKVGMAPKNKSGVNTNIYTTTGTPVERMGPKVETAHCQLQMGPKEERAGLETGSTHSFVDRRPTRSQRVAKA
jgi:hypothetical protein